MQVPVDPRHGFCTPAFFDSLELTAKTILDIGVQRGTPWLYNSFPDLPFLLIDPQPEGEMILESKPQQYQFVQTALGSQPGTATLDLRGPRSSLNQWSSKAPHKSEGSAKVAIRTLDDVLDEYRPEGPLGLKIDTEGYEMEVLSGLTAHASSVEFIISETNIRDRFDDTYRFGDLINLCMSKGFDFYNFISPHQARPTHYDCLFLKRDHRLFGIGNLP